jgi:hypothetical protein
MTSRFGASAQKGLSFLYNALHLPFTSSDLGSTIFVALYFQTGLLVNYCGV